MRQTLRHIFLAAFAMTVMTAFQAKALPSDTFTSVTAFLNRSKLNGELVRISPEGDGRLTVFAIGKVAEGYHAGKYWMYMQDCDEKHTTLLIEKDDAYSVNFVIGSMFEYIDFNLDFNRADAGSNGRKINEVAGGVFSGSMRDRENMGEAVYEEKLITDGLPYVYKNTVVNGNCINRGPQSGKPIVRLMHKFEGCCDDFVFEDGAAYNIWGIHGWDTPAGQSAQCDVFYLIKAEKVTETPVTPPTSIAEAFASGGGKNVTFDCELRVVAMSYDFKSVFVYDNEDNTMMLRGDFIDLIAEPGTILRNVTADISEADGMRYADVTVLPVAGNIGKLPEVVVVDDPATLADYACKYVKIKAKIDRVSAESKITGRSDAFPEISVGGVRINRNAISDEVGRGIENAVTKYNPDREFTMTGIVAADQDGAKEFWPTDILDYTGMPPTTAVTEIESGNNGIIIDGRRVVTPANAKIFDISGRQVLTTELKPGIYFINTEAKVYKILIK